MQALFDDIEDRIVHGFIPATYSLIYTLPGTDVEVNGVVQVMPTTINRLVLIIDAPPLSKMKSFPIPRRHSQVRSILEYLADNLLTYDLQFMRNQP